MDLDKEKTSEESPSFRKKVESSTSGLRRDMMSFFSRTLEEYPSRIRSIDLASLSDEYILNGDLRKDEEEEEIRKSPSLCPTGDLPVCWPMLHLIEGLRASSNV
ncbi:hypothetical protein HAX54_020707 [Datura stramonium]|uniref:Uncharacterized protein n=1 Tax=Datura stramonium TaxID=4076 RepID=A0ABS8URK2_DATST|nr:hypothetical protein [Datura stramonium]